MIIKNLIDTPNKGKLSFGLLLYKISLIVCVTVIAIFTILLGGSLLFIWWASSVSGGSSEGAGMMLILPILFWTWTCLAQIPFGIYGIVYNRRYKNNKNRRTQIKMLVIVTVFCTLPPLAFFLSYPGIIFNIIYNFSGKNPDFTNYSSYSVVKKEIDDCHIDYVDWNMINGIGGYYKGNVLIKLYTQNSSTAEYLLKASDKTRLYTDLKQSSCNYPSRTYEHLMQDTDYNGDHY